MTRTIEVSSSLLQLAQRIVDSELRELRTLVSSMVIGTSAQSFAHCVLLCAANAKRSDAMSELLDDLTTAALVASLWRARIAHWATTFDDPTESEQTALLITDALWFANLHAEESERTTDAQDVIARVQALLGESDPVRSARIL